MVRAFIAALCLSIGSTFSFAALGSDSPLEGVPEPAAVLVRLKSPEATTKKVSDFASQIKAEYGQTITQSAGALGAVIQNPMQAGVDKSRDWWLVVFGEAGHAPSVVYAVPATDAALMKRTLGERI